MKQYSLLHSPNPYKVYQLANSSITVNVLNDGRIQFIVSIGIGDPVNWMVAINAKHDHGQGTYGGDYPYAVEGVLGSQNTTFYRTANSGYYWPDDYSAVLKLAGVGDVDFATFTIGGGGGGCQPDKGQKYCNNNKTRCQWNQSKCNYDCFGCPSGQQCSNGDCVSGGCQPLEGVTKYCGSDGKTKWTWNPITCKYDSSVCPSGQKCSNGDCIITQPSEKYIIHWKIYTGKGGKVNVYRNGSPFGTVTGSAIQTFTFNVGDVLRYEAVPDSGWKYDGTCNSGDNTCDSTNPYEGTISIPMEFSAASVFTPEGTQYHNVCKDNTCTQVSGAGTNECINIGEQCSTPTVTSTTTTCNKEKEFDLTKLGFGCVKKSDVYIVIGGVALFMILSR